MIITDIKTIKGNSVVVYMEDEPLMQSTKWLCREFEVYTGQDYTAEFLLQFNVACEIYLCYQKALRLLSSQPRSKKYISDALFSKDFKKENIDTSIDILELNGLINDKKTAVDYAVMRIEKKSYGPYALRSDLYAKKFGKQTIDDTVKEMYERYEIEELAYKSLTVKYKNLKKMSYEDVKKNFFYFYSKEVSTEVLL